MYTKTDCSAGSISGDTNFDVDIDEYGGTITPPPV